MTDKGQLTTFAISPVITWARQTYGENFAENLAQFFLGDPLLKRSFTRFVWKSVLRQMNEES